MSDDVRDFLHLPALSIRQPWALLITRGHKDIENRSWRTKYRGEFLIHAGLHYHKRDHAEAMQFAKARMSLGAFNDTPFNDWDFERGAIIGVAEIVDCVTKSDSPWFTGEHGFVIRNARELHPADCKGRLGFFKINEAEIDPR